LSRGCSLHRPFYVDHRVLHSFPTRRSSDLRCWWVLWWAAVLVVGVQFFVQFNGGLVGFALNRTGLAVATEQQIVFAGQIAGFHRSEEHTSELQSRENLVCRLLLEKKNTTDI